MMVMHNSFKLLFWFLVAIVFNSLALGVQSDQDSASQAENENVWSGTYDVYKRLFNDREDLVSLAIEVRDSKSRNASEAVDKIEILLRACLEEEACKAVDELAEHISKAEIEALDDNIPWFFQNLFRKYKCYSVVHRGLERFAGYFNHFPFSGNIFRDLEGNEYKPWTKKKKLAWIEERIKSVEKFDKTIGQKVRGRRGRIWGQKQPIDLWEDMRFGVLVEMGRGEKEIKLLTKQIRRDPDNAKLPFRYMKWTENLRAHNQKKLTINDFEWLKKTARFKHVTDLQGVANFFMDSYVELFSMAEFYYRSAIKKELTDVDIKRATMFCSDALPEKTHRLYSKVKLLEDLSTCLLKQGKKDEAQKAMVRSADIREKNNLGGNLHFAGLSQMATGGRVIEDRILEEEKKVVNRNDPKYWSDRADYYSGRKELDKVEHAFSKGLALTNPKSDKGSEEANYRCIFIRGLLDLLNSQKRNDEVFRLALKEMKIATVNSRTSGLAAAYLAPDINKLKSSDQDLLWNWLNNRTRWESWERNVLKSMLAAVQTNRRQEFFKRAEKMVIAKDADPSRANTLGRAMSHFDEKKRSIPVLIHAVKTAKYLKNNGTLEADGSRSKDNSWYFDNILGYASTALYNSYLHLGDWRNAEKVIWQTEKEQPREWNSRRLVSLIPLTVKDKSPEDAVRIFRRVINCNFHNDSLIRDMKSAGLGKEVREYFDAVQKKLPYARARV